MPTRQRMVNKPWPYKAQALRLHELDDDVLSLIVTALAHESLRSLQALALVSGRFWNLCAPLLFRKITWTGAGAVPHGVAVQTRCVRWFLVLVHRKLTVWRISDFCISLYKPPILNLRRRTGARSRCRYPS